MKTLTEYTESPKQEYSFDEFVVKKLPQGVGRDFIKAHHYTGGCGTASMTWGMYSQRTSELLGVIAFQTPISENVRKSVFGEEQKHRVTELHRMAIVDRAPHNAGSWFISRTLDKLKAYKPKYKAVVSFADTTEGHDGTVYQAANADYYGTTDKVTYYRTPDGQLKAPRQVGENITLSDAKERGWEPEQRDTKHRYVFWLPDEYQDKKSVRDMAEINLQDYPE
jgi:hypothetical protein